MSNRTYFTIITVSGFGAYGSSNEGTVTMPRLTVKNQADAYQHMLRVASARVGTDATSSSVLFFYCVELDSQENEPLEGGSEKTQESES